MNSWELRLLAPTLLATASFGCGQSSVQQATSQTKADLPEISAFVTKPSDRFLVDVKEVSRGHPFLGINSPHPHGGAHVHFDNTKNCWPKGKDEPGNYPAIYAVVDGVVSRIDTHFTLSGGNDRYGLDLTFARDQTGLGVPILLFHRADVPGAVRRFLQEIPARQRGPTGAQG